MYSLLPILVGVAAAVGVLLAILRPVWSFVLIISMFAVEQLLQSYVPIFAARASLFNFVTAGVCSAAVGMRLLRRDQITSGYGNPVTILTLCVYVLWTAGLLYTIAPDHAFDVFQQSIPYLILYLLIFPLLVIDIYEFRKALNVLLLVGTVTAALIILNPHTRNVGGRFLLDIGTGFRFGSALAVAELGATTAIVAALYKPPKTSQLITALRVAAFISGFGIAIYSGSRGQVLSAAVCGILFFPLARKLNNPKQFFIGVFGLGVLLLGVYTVFGLFIGFENQQRWDTDRMADDFAGRWQMVAQLLEAYVSSPGYWLFGLGPGAFFGLTGMAYVHNVPAEMLCEHGIVGAALFCAIFALVIKYGRNLWLMFRDDPSLRSTVAVLLAICLNEFILTLKQGSISTPAPFFWWMVMAKLYHHEVKVAAEAAAFEQSEPDLADDSDSELAPA